ncbi:MAG TPA: tRNA (adenosine(37)-N6)-threonylcarbamoyltransferase complex transferase subunit TsaD, partial [Chloroflexota bacterium]|nr:tRNA (adenosine(37)-N6)-threonylcarbamoyltransferase complex transferase subunit TsaD [Chloroflexota bacterium]
MPDETLILGIETSCDETAASVVRDGRQIMSSIVASQIDIHRAFGGVVPEVASRQHVLTIVPTIESALGDAGVDWNDLACIAPTCGPGLVGALLVGLNAAKGAAFARGLPLVGVNHLEGHIYANWLTDATIEFPTVCLIVSGAHTDLVLMTDHLTYRILGRTRDDAAGEAFDKVARLLGLGYPGGPAIQTLASTGDSNKLTLPRAWLGESYDFSFSGLKTAVLRVAEGTDDVGPLTRADVAASFQEAVVDVLVTKTLRAAEEFGVRQVLLAGGVAANRHLRNEMDRRLDRQVIYPPLALCTDNAAMIAAAGYFRFRAGYRSDLDL